MDSNGAPSEPINPFPQPTPPSSPMEQPSDGKMNQASQATGEFIHNNYETWLRKIFGAFFSVLKFIQFTIMQIINQVLSK